MYILIFIIILAVLVFVHELGHFLAAKASGIRVDEFGIGFPPTIASFKRGETRYALNAIPFGGYVKIFGEDPDQESMSGPDKARSFVHKPKSIQAMVLAAGIFFNLVFAWLLISLGFMIGMPVPASYQDMGDVKDVRMLITGIQEGSPADKAGFKAGDTITTLSSGTDSLSVFNVDQFQNFISTHADKPITVTYTREGQTQTTDVTPTQGIVSGKPAIGVMLEVLGTIKLSFFKALYEGAKLTYEVIIGTTLGLGAFIGSAFIGQAELSQVSGPVGIAGLVGDATRLGLVYLISFTAFISINLAIINLIPFPALDGGRILFVLIEKIKGSPINPKIANSLNGVGFSLLIILMLVVTFNDIIKLFK